MKKALVIGLLTFASLSSPSYAEDWSVAGDGMVYKKSETELIDSTIGVKLNDNATMGVYFYLSIGDCGVIEGKYMENRFMMNNHEYRAFTVCREGQLTIAPVGRGIHEAIKLLYTSPVIIISPDVKSSSIVSYTVFDFKDLVLTNPNVQ